MGGNRGKGNTKTQQVKRAAEGGSGLSPDNKRSNSPASGVRARSLELNSRRAVSKAVSSKLAQPTLDSYVSAAAGSAADREHGGKESTNSGPVAEQAAFPALPGGGEAPSPPVSDVKFPELPPHSNAVVHAAYGLMCDLGTKFQGRIKNEEDLNVAELVDGYIHVTACLGAFMADFYRKADSFADVVKSHKVLQKNQSDFKKGLDSVQSKVQIEKSQQVFEDDNADAQVSLHFPRAQQVLPGVLDDLKDEGGRATGISVLEDFWRFIEQKSSLVPLGTFHRGMLVDCYLKKKPARGNQPAAAMLTVKCSDRRSKQRIQQLVRRKIDVKEVAGNKPVPLLRKLPAALQATTTVLDARLRHRKANVAANQSFNIITATAHALKKQGDIAGFDAAFSWSGNSPAVSLSTRGSGENRFTSKFCLDPTTVLCPERGVKYIKDQIRGKIPSTNLGQVFSEDFMKKLNDTRETYKAILDTFSSARARKKLKGRGEKNGEVGKTPSAEGVQVQPVLEGAPVAAPRPSVTQP